MAVQQKRLLPFSRYLSYGTMGFYYAFGNTPPVDYLEHIELVHNKIEQTEIFENMTPHRPNNAKARILILGIGDLRSCFYTMWKMDLDLKTGILKYPPKPDKLAISFVCNDYDPAVLARNVIFIYLAMLTATCREDAKRRQLLCAVWAIWYCNELLQSHVMVLKDALEELAKASQRGFHRWQDPEGDFSVHLNSLIGIVKFENESAFKEITNHWIRWLSWLDRRYPSLEGMRADRAQYLTFHFRRMGCAHDFTIMQRMKYSQFQPGPLFFTAKLEKGPTMSEQHINKRVQLLSNEFDEYHTGNGSPYAEEVLLNDWKAPRGDSQKVVNPTFYAQEKYSVHYGSVPFQNYNLAPNFTPANFNWRRRPDQIPLAKFYIPESKFVKKPALANSVQQFSIWFATSAKLLSVECQSKIEDHKLSLLSIDFRFEFAIDDCCQLLRRFNAKNSSVNNKQDEKLANHREFDAIYTSNLMDHVPFPNLIGLAIPLLTDVGFFMTSSLRFGSIALNQNDFLSKIMGLHVELFPSILGIQAVGCEGKYSDTRFWPYTSGEQASRRLIEDKLAPESRFGNLELVFKTLERKCLPWKLKDLEDSPVLCKILSQSCLINTTACTHSREDLGPGHRSASSFFVLLKLFVNRMLIIESELENSTESILGRCQFWEPLVAEIKMITPGCFWEELQAMAFVNGFHWHLTLTEVECSRCDPNLEASVIAVEAELTGMTMADHVSFGSFMGVVILGDDEIKKIANREHVLNRLNGSHNGKNEVASFNYQIFNVIDVDDGNVLRGTPTGSSHMGNNFMGMFQEHSKLRFLVRRSALIANRSYLDIFGSCSIKQHGSRGITVPVDLFTGVYGHAQIDTKEIDDLYEPISVFKPISYHNIDIKENLFNIAKTIYSTDRDFATISSDTAMPSAPQNCDILLELMLLRKPPKNLSLKLMTVAQKAWNAISFGVQGYGAIDIVLPFSVKSKAFKMALLDCFSSDSDRIVPKVQLTSHRVRTQNALCDLARRMSFTNPENHILYYKIEPSKKEGQLSGLGVIPAYTTMMFKREEAAVLRRSTANLSSSLRILCVFKTLFDSCLDSKYFHFAFTNTTYGPDTFALGFVLDVYYDLARQSPAIDFMFCPLNPLWPDEIMTKVVGFFMDAREKEPIPHGAALLELDNFAQYDLLKAYFNFFSFRTRINPDIEPYFPRMLQQANLRHYWQRCLVYPLYMDPGKINDRTTTMQGTTSSPRLSTVTSQQKDPVDVEGLRAAMAANMLASQESLLTGTKRVKNAMHPDNCVWCNDPGRKRCGRCNQVQYCGPICQREHWSEHKKVCGKVQLQETKVSNTSKSTKTPQKRCAVCEKNKKLNKCARCKSVWYCGSACQQVDWPSHKLICVSSSTEPEGAPEEADSNTLQSDKNSDSNHMRNCALCEGVGKNRCGGCKNVWYCDVECQKKHWPMHKPNCLKQ